VVGATVYRTDSERAVIAKPRPRTVGKVRWSTATFEVTAIPALPCDPWRFWARPWTPRADMDNPRQGAHVAEEPSSTAGWFVGLARGWHGAARHL